MSRTAEIQRLNEALRRDLTGGRLLLTPGSASWAPSTGWRSSLRFYDSTALQKCDLPVTAVAHSVNEPLEESCLCEIVNLRKRVCRKS